MLITNDKIAADKARKWSSQSREKAPWYQHEDVGYNYRMSNIIAGIGRGQMLHIDEHIEAKKRVFDIYREGLKDLPISMNPHLDCSEPNFWLSCILIDRDAMCEQSRTEHDAEFVTGDGKSCPTEILEQLIIHNAEGRPIWKPMHLQPIFKDNDFISAEDGRDVSADIFERGMCLPSDIKMTKEQQKIVIEIIKSCF